MRIKVELDGGIRLMWPTPVMQRVFGEAKDLNPRLRALIAKREKRDAGVGKSVVGGWHSREDLMAWPEPEIGRLRDWIVEAVKAIIVPTTGKTADAVPATGTISAWANILRNGGYHRMHTHPGSVWSGVYYIDTGRPDPDHPTSGRLELYDPRTAVEMMPMATSPYGQPFLVDPRPGMMVVFPSWVRHMVHPFIGEGARVTIGWNMLVTEQHQG